MHNSTRSAPTAPRTKVVARARTSLVIPLLVAAAAFSPPRLRSQDLDPQTQAPQPAQLTPTQAAAGAATTAAQAALPFTKPGVQAIPGLREQALSQTRANPSQTPRKKSYTLDVNGAQWLDTGLDVTGGETLSTSAKGTLALSDGRSASPAGLDRGWKDLLRQYPLNQAPAAALLGRVTDLGASVPFVIGDKSSVVMPTSGRLFLRANLPDDLAADGTFAVTLKPVAPTKPAATSSTVVSTPPTAVSALVSPALFNTIPRRVADQAGDPGDMVNFALVGSEADVQAAFQNAGWVAVDRSTGAAVLHGLLATLSHEAYTAMPMSTLFLFGRPQDLSFERADPLKVAAERHHLRVWNTGKTLDGRALWVGSATHDIGFERDQRNNGTTHKIDPDIDAERTFLLQSFDAAGDLSSAAYVTPADPLLTARTATGGSFHSDGRIAVLDLKPDLK